MFLRVLTVVVAMLAWTGAAQAQQASIPERPSAEMWQLMAAIESNRPAFSPRTLSGAEKGEAKRLAANYKEKSRTAAAWEQLKILAQSGDRDAMLLARDAIKRGVPNEFRAQFADTPETRKFMTTLSDSLAALWTAYVWEMHGVEPAGIPIIEPCVGGLRDSKGKTIIHPQVGEETYPLPDAWADRTELGCGFRLQARLVRQYKSYKAINDLPKGAVKFEYSMFNGAKHYRDATKDFHITGVTFHPVWGNAEFLEQTFTEHVAARKRGQMVAFNAQLLQAKDMPVALQLTLPWYEYYAVATGRPDLIRQSDATAQSARLKMSADFERQRIRDWDAKMDAFRNAPDDYETGMLARESRELGGRFMLQFRELEAQLRPQLASTAPGVTGSSGGGGSPSSNQSVEVRNYDSSGTYVGSTQTSAAWADIMKMTSSPPR